jgi:hypothetical protein
MSLEKWEKGRTFLNRKLRSFRCRREEAEKPEGASNSQICTGPILLEAFRNVLSAQFLRQSYL